MENLATRHLTKKAMKFRILEIRFVEAAQRVREGHGSASLGGGLFKERIAREGQGRSGGYRTLCCLREDGIVIFFSVFAKKDKDNLDKQELLEARRVAAGFKALSEEDLRAALAAGALTEINHGADDALTQPDAKT